MLFQKDDELERYKRLRKVEVALNRILVRQLGKSAIHEGGRDLGVMKRGTLIFESDDEMTILMDYCIHNHRIGKKTVVERYLETSPPDPVSDEMLLLRALRDSFFSVFVVTGLEKGYLCYVQDILRGGRHIIMDTGFGSTSSPGLLIASRLTRVPVSNKCMTTGAAIPIARRDVWSEIQHIVGKFADCLASGTFSKTLETSFAKQVTRTALRSGCLEQVRYAKPGVFEV